jgi:hypothetical protein
MGSPAPHTGSLRRMPRWRGDGYGGRAGHGDGRRAGNGGGGRLTTGRRPRRPGRRIVVAALLGLVATAFPAAPARAATWSVVPTPNASTAGNVLVGVDARGPNDVWAVGHADHAPSQPFQRPLAARWNGTSWSAVGTPALTGDAWFRGVDGSSSGNVWAVGMRAVPAGGGSVGAAPLTELWNGSSWSVRPAPTPPNATGASLEGVKTFSATSAWAVGNHTASSAPFARTLIQRWNGTSWSVVPSPNPDASVNLLADVDGAAPDDVWAVGNVGQDGYGSTVAGVVLHWNGSAWSRVAVPGAAGDATLRMPVLEDVHAISRDDVWIVGRAFHFGQFRQVPIWMHWNGTSWRYGFVAGAAAGGFTGVTALSATRVYAVGDVTARWNGTAWSVESAGAAGRMVDAAATGTGTVWGVGYRYDMATATIRTAAVRTQNG